MELEYQAMPRAKYQVTDRDYTHVSAYLSDKLQLQSIDIRGDASLSVARRDLLEVAHSGQRKGRAERLNAWCEQYLPTAEWSKLKTATRKRRERWERHDQLKTITISAKAHRLLLRIANRDGVTFSEALEQRLAKF